MHNQQQQLNMALHQIEQKLKEGVNDPTERALLAAGWLVFTEALHTLERIATALEMIEQNTAPE